MLNQTKCQTKLNAKCQNSSTHLKHMQYPPNQHNWATDSVCCTVKECGRSRVQHTARIATVARQLNINKNPHTPSQTASLSLSLPLPLLSYHIANAYNNPLTLFFF